MKRPICGTKLLTGPCVMREGKARYLKCRWDGQPPRAPKKGEMFISGAIPQAYRCTSDEMTTEYFIAVEDKNA
jgi:hypothetical protein